MKKTTVLCQFSMTSSVQTSKFENREKYYIYNNKKKCFDLLYDTSLIFCKIETHESLNLS